MELAPTPLRQTAQGCLPEWPSDSLPEVAPVAGPPPGMSKELVRKALSRMKSGKAAGPSGDLAEMLKAAGEEGIELTRDLVEEVFSTGDSKGLGGEHHP